MSELLLHTPVPGQRQPAAEQSQPSGRRDDAGPASISGPVAYRAVMSRHERLVFLLLLAGTVWLTVRYALWWFDLDHVPLNRRPDGGVTSLLANLGPFVALTLLEALRVLQMGVTWVFALFMRTAVRQQPRTDLRVAVLTAIVPSKEPVSMLAETLAAMQRIRYDGGFDIWVLDEGDDPAVRELCTRLGVGHFSRHGIERYNQPDGPFKARTKAGNHNAWADQHGQNYDVVAQMDLDHLPTEDFLEATLGYFNDPDVAYVIAPQVYYRNAQESWIARGADEQNFGFSALTQRGANTLGMPIFIGSNHLARTSALESVGGYASHIVEDHLTGMQLLTSTNPSTGRRWKGVFTEHIISHGEGPSRWSSYLSQQLRWSYGLVDILRHHSVRLLMRMRPTQALGFALIQSYYVSMATILVLGVSLTTAHLLLGVDAVDVSFSGWVGHWLPQLAASVGLWYWLQRFYVRPSDRGWGFKGIFVGMGAVVTYLQACVMCLLRRPLVYVVTPKGEVGTREPLRLFSWHLAVLGLSVGALAYALWQQTGAPTIRFWAGLNAVQMSLVVATGALVPGVLRTRPRWRALAAVNRPLLRVAVPGVVTVVAVSGLIAVPASDPITSAAEGTQHAAPHSADAPQSNSDRVTGSQRLGDTTVLEPLPTVPAPFLSRRSDEVAFGVFELSTPMGMNPAIHHEFIDFGRSSIARLDGAVTEALTRRAVPMLSWEPKINGRPARSRGVLASIAEGRRDGYLATAAQTLAQRRQLVLLRFAPEMDHVTDELHPWSGRSPELFVKAWRRVHRIFAGEGADNVRFAWTPGGYFVDGRFASDTWYPGDRFVDVVGFSAYLFWGWEEQDPARVAGHTYRSPAQLLGPRYRAISRHGKPVILPEVGIHLHRTRLDEQARWLRALVRYVDRELPDLAAMVYFHAPHNFDDYDIDWRLTAREKAALADALTASDRVNLGSGRGTTDVGTARPDAWQAPEGVSARTVRW